MARPTCHATSNGIPSGPVDGQSDCVLGRFDAGAVAPGDSRHQYATILQPVAYRREQRGDVFLKQILYHFRGKDDVISVWRDG